MFYLNYDLAKHITDHRRAEAMQRAQSRAARAERRRLRNSPADEADVIELSFAAPCEQERIGA